MASFSSLRLVHGDFIHPKLAAAMIAIVQHTPYGDARDVSGG